MDMKKYDGHRQRLYQRFQDVGLQGFAEHEKLELLLTLVIPRRDCKPLAKALLERFGSLGAVFHADPEDLNQVPGVGPKSVLFLGMIKAIAAESLKEELQKNKKTFYQVQDLVRYVRLSSVQMRREVFKVLFLDTQHALMAEEIIAEGTVDEAPVYIRNIVESVIRHNAKMVVLVHNHPSGNPRPSRADKEMTEKIQAALDLIQVKVLDHIVLGEQSYTSFSEKGWV